MPVTFMIVISSALLTLLVNYICHDQEKSKNGTYKKGGYIKEIQMMSLYPPFLYVPFLELFFQVTHSLSKFFWLWCRHVRNVRWSRKKLYTAKIYVGISFNRQLALLSLYLGLMLHWPRTSCCRAQVRGVQNALSSPTFSEFRQGK